MVDLSSTNQKFFCQSQHPITWILQGLIIELNNHKVNYLHNLQTITLDDRAEAELNIAVAKYHRKLQIKWYRRDINWNSISLGPTVIIRAMGCCERQLRNLYSCHIVYTDNTIYTLPVH